MSMHSRITDTAFTAGFLLRLTTWLTNATIRIFPQPLVHLLIATHKLLRLCCYRLCVNPLKCSCVRQLHLKAFNAIQV